MSEATERLLVRIDATTESLRRELKRADAAVAGSQSAMEKALGSMQKGWANADKWVQRHSTQLKLMGVAAVVGTGAAVKALAGYSDRYQQLQGQLRLVTDSQDELNSVWTRSLALSNDTGASIDSTVNLYARMARSTEELNLTQDQLFTITKAVNQSFVVSGASAQEADSAILQLSQGMAAGALRGEELNSVMENSPRLARALADGLGVTIGKLREMGQAGELTTEAVTGALLKMSGGIQEEFNAMPVTVARATNKIQNLLADAFGKADMAPLLEGLDELATVVSDPRIVAGLTELAGAIAKVAAATVSAAAQLPDFLKWISGNADDLSTLYTKLYNAETQLANLRNKNSQQARDLRKEIEQLNKQIEVETKRLLENSKASDKAKKGTDGLSESAEDAADNIGELETYLKLTTKQIEEMAKELDKAKKAHEQANKAITDGIEEIDKIVKATDDYIKELEFEVSLIGKSAREQALLTAAHEHGAMATEEQREKMAALNATLYDAKEAAAVAAKAAEENAAAWKKSREVLSGFFFEFALEGKNAFDTLYEGFRAMLMKMIADAAANQIILGIGAAFGAAGYPGATAAASAMTGAGSAGSAALLTPFAQSGFNYFAQNSSLFTNQGLQFAVPGDGGAALGPQFNWANAGYGVAGGLAGGWAGRQAFGNTTGVGATAGAALGTLIPYVGPFIGSAIGSFLGTGLERGLGNVFGFGGNGGNNAARSIFDLSTGSVNSFGINNFDQANLDMASQLTAAIMALSATIGGSSFSGNLKVGNRSGIKLDGQRFDDAEQFLQYAFRETIESASNLSDELKSLLLGFDGTAEQVLEFSAAVISLNDMAGINSVTQAIEDFNRVQPTMRQAYYDQSSDLLTLIANFDGSAAAATELANALAINKQAAYDFAMAIQQIGAMLDQATADSVAKIRESVMTPGELREQRRAERDFARAILPHLTDPQQIQAAVDLITKNNESLFFSLPEELRTPERAEEFATYSENANMIGQKLLDRQLAGIEDVQANLNAGVEAMLTRTAAQFADAGATLQGAANTFAAVIARLSSQGITVNVQQGSEVNV